MYRWCLLQDYLCSLSRSNNLFLACYTLILLTHNIFWSPATPLPSFAEEMWKTKHSLLITIPFLKTIHFTRKYFITEFHFVFTFLQVVKSWWWWRRWSGIREYKACKVLCYLCIHYFTRTHSFLFQTKRNPDENDKTFFPFLPKRLKTQPPLLLLAFPLVFIFLKHFPFQIYV